nr:hypothetical protein CFP56_21872 [Quercus suber]
MYSPGPPMRSLGYGFEQKEWNILQYVSVHKISSLISEVDKAARRGNSKRGQQDTVQALCSGNVGRLATNDLCRACVTGDLHGHDYCNAMLMIVLLVVTPASTLLSARVPRTTCYSILVAKCFSETFVAMTIPRHSRYVPRLSTSSNRASSRRESRQPSCRAQGTDPHPTTAPATTLGRMPIESSMLRLSKQTASYIRHKAKAA